MDWSGIGARIRRQREFMGYTREQLAEMLDITPKFCSDIELGAKGMSVQTLCRISDVLHLSADYILFGQKGNPTDDPISPMLQNCSKDERHYAEQMLKIFFMAMKSQK